MDRRDRRTAIMQAAEKLFTSRRFHEITLDDVVREARVGKGTVYRYFRDKDDLFFQTATRGFDELCELITRKVPESGSFVEQLLRACQEVSAFFSRRRQLFRMMQAEGARLYWFTGDARERWMEHRKKLVAAVAQIIGRGIREGEIRDDVPAEILASFLLGMLRTRARDLAGVPDRSRPPQLVVDLFCGGAGRPGRRTPAGSARRL
jgi:TetR/AcrR family transcriptional regulator